MAQNVIVYIDGFNLYFGLKEKGWKRLYWLNPWLLGINLLKQGQNLVTVKYFTARISASPNDPGKQKRQSTFLEAIESLPNTSVFYGHYLQKPQKCNKCGATWLSHEEKMTDVRIAVELLNDAYDNAFDVALLVSADSDLAPPVEDVVKRFPAKKVIAIAPPARRSSKLELVASASFRLGRGTLHNSQFPDHYTKTDGFTLTRPATWR